MRDRVEQITGVRVDGEVSDHSHPVTLASDRRGVLGASSVPSFVWLSGLGAHATAWAGALGAIAAGMALGSVATDHEALAGLLTSLSPQRFRNSAP
jgi:glycine/D-amino acid oxidase-like deaminating enzyme